jgi:hypothetical protein
MHDAGVPQYMYTPPCFWRMIQVCLHIYIHEHTNTYWDVYGHTPLEAGMREQQNGMCVCLGVKTQWCVKVVRWCVKV